MHTGKHIGTPVYNTIITSLHMLYNIALYMLGMWYWYTSTVLVHTYTILVHTYNIGTKVQYWYTHTHSIGTHIQY